MLLPASFPRPPNRTPACLSPLPPSPPPTLIRLPLPCCHAGGARGAPGASSGRGGRDRSGMSSVELNRAKRGGKGKGKFKSKKKYKRK